MMGRGVMSCSCSHVKTKREDEARRQYDRNAKEINHTDFVDRVVQTAPGQYEFGIGLVIRR